MNSTTLYLTEDLQRQVEALAIYYNTPKARIMREALTSGMDRLRQKAPRQNKVLLDLAKIGGHGPRDLSEKHDQYLWS